MVWITGRAKLKQSIVFVVPHNTFSEPILLKLLVSLTIEKTQSHLCCLRTRLSSALLLLLRPSHSIICLIDVILVSFLTCSCLKGVMTWKSSSSSSVHLCEVEWLCWSWIEWFFSVSCFASFFYLALSHPSPPAQPFLPISYLNVHFRRSQLMLICMQSASVPAVNGELKWKWKGEKEQITVHKCMRCLLAGPPAE